MAGAAFLLDDLPGAAAVAAGGNVHHLAEGAVPHDAFLSGAVAVRAGLHVGAGFRAGAVALGAGLFFLHGEGLLHAARRFAEGDLHVVAEIVAALRTVPLTPAGSAGEHVEDVPHVEAALAAEPAEASKSALAESAEAAGPGAALLGLFVGVVADLVVLGALVRVGERLIGFVDFLEFIGRGGIVLVQVRMVFPGHFPVGFLDVVFRGVPVDAEYFIIIPCCHTSSSCLISYRRLRLCSPRRRCRRLCAPRPAGPAAGLPAPAAGPERPAAPAGRVFPSVRGAAS